MRIVTFADRFSSVGGIERVQLDVGRGLVAHGHDLTVLVKDPGELGARWASLASVVRVDGFTVRRDRPVAGVRRVLATARRAAAAAPDVVYVHRHAVVQSAWPAALFAGRVPIVCHLHAMAPPRRGSITRFLHRRVACYIAVSDAVARSWHGIGIPPSRVVTIHNGVDTGHFVPADEGTRARVRAALGIPGDAFVVCYAGRIASGKGVHVLADAAAAVARNHPEIHLLLVGATPDRVGHDDDPRYVDDVAGRVPPHTTWVPRQVDVRPSLHAADVAVVPSVESDSFPLAVLEALACGLPVVASRIGGIPEQLAGALAEGLVAPGDVRELSERLTDLLGWRSRRPDLGSRGRAVAVERFSVGRAVDAVERVLISAVTAASRRRPPAH